jgi:triphosphoribosyl-dephospho-CoA synthetase
MHSFGLCSSVSFKQRPRKKGSLSAQMTPLKQESLSHARAQMGVGIRGDGEKTNICDEKEEEAKDQEREKNNNIKRGVQHFE